MVSMKKKGGVFYLGKRKKDFLGFYPVRSNPSYSLSKFEEV